ncbi:MAG TPA: hypothetical protein DCS07_10770 [Bdellovibrionales bacterium]|nr:MAG: hypothetical protein A2Z97_14195 [Bdellovibrionales bacterium GWB1_52_6]OFZ03281.1 MAG: hypothetical protein A2X97_10180 [Bdellovibrionales bacterium GWA1_52_35]OFZ40173.1 MAG: hypothetical protein A2070_11790 [Bdellovibrionales bacterium GWC1_52_8]HAR43092.1 hypothetical protein [Bdellovibrionales bacterium]HCM40533.1 hypothetical protein [Bdellovibrionales bacterium]
MTTKDVQQPDSIIRLGIPIAFAHLANMLMQIVDMVFVGKLGPEALGGLSIGNAVFAMVMVSGIGFLLGLDYFISHALGAGKQDEANGLLIQGLYLATWVSLPSILIMYVASFFYEPFGIPAGVSSVGQNYLQIMAVSLWPWLLFTVCRQFLQSMGAATPVLVILLLANIVNAAGNWLFVFGNWNFPELGASGSALATGIARVFMMASIMGYILYMNRKWKLGINTAPRRFSWPKFKMLVRMGAPAGGQLLIEVAVFAFSTLLAGKLGAISLSAHHIVLQIASVTFMIPLGIASATAVLVARSVGAGKPALASQYGWKGIIIGTSFMAICGLVLILIPSPLLRVFTADDSVIAVGSQLIFYAALFQIFDGAQVVGSGALRGIGNTRAPLIANFIGHWIIGLPVGATLCFFYGEGVSGLWIGLTLGLTIVSFSLVWLWKNSKNRATHQVTLHY